MGVFSRPDSPWWWLYLETAPRGQRKERSQIKIGRTVEQRRDSRQLAEVVYHKRMNEIAERVHRLPTARTTIRFSVFAATYLADVVPHHRGHEREREMLRVLTAAFGQDLVHLIDADRVKQWMTTRRQTVSARTVNRELDLLKAMLRDAVPKYLEQSPIVGLKRLTVTKPKRRLMTEAEEAKLLKAATDPVERALLINAVDSLVRLGDLLDLRREDRHGRWIYLRDPKSGEPTEVALSVRGAAALDAITGKQPFYFQKYRGAKTDRDRRSRVGRMLRKLCKKARVKYGKTKGGLTFHWATRRTGATRMLVKRQVPLPVVQRQGTWKNPDVLLQIYAEADRGDLLKAVAVFPLRSRAKRKSA